MLTRVRILGVVLQSTVQKAGLSLGGWLIAVLLVTLWPFRFFPGNGVDVEGAQGLSFQPPATAYTLHPLAEPHPVREMTIVLEVMPAEGGSYRPRVITMWGFDRQDCNFVLRQIGETAEVVWGSGELHRYYQNALPSGKWTQLVITAQSDSIRCYVNGLVRKGASTRRSETVKLTPAPIVFGSDTEGDECWEGKMRRFDVFDRAMTPEDDSGPGGIRRADSACHSYAFGLAGEGLVPDNGIDEREDLSIPESFVPYRRVVLRSPLDASGHLRQRAADIIANIVLFIPGGFFQFFLLTRRGTSRNRAAFATVALLFCLTMSIEVLQAFLPFRDSSWMDVVDNTLGGAIGAGGSWGMTPLLIRLMKKIGVG